MIKWDHHAASVLTAFIDGVLAYWMMSATMWHPWIYDWEMVLCQGFCQKINDPAASERGMKNHNQVYWTRASMMC